MIRNISIGVLLPSSTILPMAKDFEIGLRVALNEHINTDEFNIQIVPEFIGQGGKVNVENAINKLFGYHQVDVITGIVSNQIGMEVADKFAKNQKPFLINNIGEHIPDPRLFNQYIFINSTHIWQQVWSLGNWAVKQFGKKGMFVGSVYDAGYAFTSMLKLGMEAADPQVIMPFSIAPMTQQSGASDPKSVFNHILEFNPDFILSVFCGDEAKIFQEEYIRLGLHKTKPLLALPFLLQSFDSGTDALEVFTTMVVNDENLIEEMDVKLLNSDNPFHALGSEAGLILAEAFKMMKDKDITTALSNIKVNAKRGQLDILSNKPGIHDEIYLVRNIHNGDKSQIKREIIKKLPKITIHDNKLLEMLDSPSSGWGNPYLGI